MIDSTICLRSYSDLVEQHFFGMLERAYDIHSAEFAEAQKVLGFEVLRTQPHVDVCRFLLERAGTDRAAEYLRVLRYPLGLEAMSWMMLLNRLAAAHALNTHDSIGCKASVCPRS